MTPDEIREELLGQHESLREIIERVRTADESELGQHMTQLRDAITAHNARETELLGDLLPSVDAWGELRAKHMKKDHKAEFRGIETFATNIGEMGTVTAIAAAELVDDLLAHLDHEESLYLNENVLRDDPISIAQSDG